ncbi:MAG TPA: hypothetical protein VMM15_24245, partial [Bradyrhizobium sp.]|nr:hypothetical protein [Bradyrhizobium sp.]
TRSRKLVVDIPLQIHNPTIVRSVYFVSILLEIYCLIQLNTVGLLREANQNHGLVRLFRIAGAELTGRQSVEPPMVPRTSDHDVAADFVQGEILCLARYRTIDHVVDRLHAVTSCHHKQHDHAKGEAPNGTGLDLQQNAFLQLAIF